MTFFRTKTGLRKCTGDGSAGPNISSLADGCCRDGQVDDRSLSSAQRQAGGHSVSATRLLPRDRQLLSYPWEQTWQFAGLFLSRELYSTRALDRAEGIIQWVA